MYLLTSLNGSICVPFKEGENVYGYGSCIKNSEDEYKCATVLDNLGNPLIWENCRNDEGK